MHILYSNHSLQKYVEAYKVNSTLLIWTKHTHCCTVWRCCRSSTLIYPCIVYVKRECLYTYIQITYKRLWWHGHLESVQSMLMQINNIWCASTKWSSLLSWNHYEGKDDYQKSIRCSCTVEMGNAVFFGDHIDILNRILFSRMSRCEWKWGL